MRKRAVIAGPYKIVNILKGLKFIGRINKGPCIPVFIVVETFMINLVSRFSVSI